MRAHVLPFLLLAISCSSSDADSSDAGNGQPATDAAAAPPPEDDAGTTPSPDDAILAASWRKLENAPTIAGKQDDVFFRADHGWSVNGKGEIWGTSDAGETWTKLFTKAGTYFRAITFVDDQHGFAGNIGTDYYPDVTDATPLYETKNGGIDWAPVTTITGAAPRGVCNFSTLDEHTIVATGRVGGPSFVIRSNDSGATWQSQDVSADLPMLVDSHFSDGQTGLLTGASSTDATSHCKILRTTDGGTTWNAAFTSEGKGEMCWKMSFPTPNVGYAAVLTFGKTKSSFLKTTDGGVTWSALPFVKGAYAALGVGFVTEKIGWIGGEASGKPAYRTRDGGLTWEADDSLGPYINRIRFLDDHTAYAIGSSIYKWEVK